MDRPTHDPLDTADAEQVQAEVDKGQRIRRLNELADVRWLMDEPRGRRFAWRLLGMAGVFRNPFAGERSQTDFNCGLQAIGQTVLAEINTACPKRYHQMVREQQDGSSSTESSDTPV